MFESLIVDQKSQKEVLTQQRLKRQGRNRQRPTGQSQKEVLTQQRLKPIASGVTSTIKSVRKKF